MWPQSNQGYRRGHCHCMAFKFRAMESQILFCIILRIYVEPYVIDYVLHVLLISIVCAIATSLNDTCTLVQEELWYQ